MNIYNPKSIAEVITSAKMHPLRRWLLRKLIPSELYELPAMEIGKLQRGDVIGKISMEIGNTSINPAWIDLGIAGKCE